MHFKLAGYVDKVGFLSPGHSCSISTRILAEFIRLFLTYMSIVDFVVDDFM